MTAERPTTERLREALLALADEMDEADVMSGPGTGEYADRIREALAAAPVDRDGLREYRFLTWDDTPLVITVDDQDPGDMGEPRMLVDYDNGPTTYVSVRAAVSEPKERP